jgi:hypothetical protein
MWQWHAETLESVSGKKVPPHTTSCSKSCHATCHIQAQYHTLGNVCYAALPFAEAPAPCMACCQGSDYTTPSIHVLHPSAHQSLKTAPMLLKIREQQVYIIIQPPIMPAPSYCKHRQSSEAKRPIGAFSCSGYFLSATPRPRVMRIHTASMAR